MRPKLLIEKAANGEISWDQVPRAPHCDYRILHVPKDCVFCSDAVELQEEREALGISNTGHANRKWPCPADNARSSKSLNAWGGNRAKTRKDLEENDKAFKDLFEKINRRCSDK